MERVEMDLIKLSNIHIKNDTDYNYILCIVDHFSKYAKIYFTKTKRSEEILELLKEYISKVGKPTILQSDNGGEFCANIIKNYLKNEGIIFINSSSRHPQTNGVVEGFNKNISNKLECVLLDKENKEVKLNLKDALLKAGEIYNNTIHSIIKVEPRKAFNFTSEAEINIVINNVIKSQKYTIKYYDSLRKGEKCLLNNSFIKKGNTLKVKFNKTVSYCIPIIIDEPLGGTQYSFKVPNNIFDFNVKIIYKADYKLIKRCDEEVWNLLLHNLDSIEN